MAHRAEQALKIYVGQTRSRALIAQLSALGYGEMTNRGEGVPKRYPFALDNGAFKDHTAGTAFDGDAFLRHVETVASLSPDFVVVPDRVGGGLDSLALSLSWLSRLDGSAPLYLVTQDGMQCADVAPYLPLFAGVFVGGSLPWKVATGAAWVNLAHSVGKPCHVGRVGTARRVGWAYRIGADSIDSCLPLWSKENLSRFTRAVDRHQGELF